MNAGGAGGNCDFPGKGVASSTRGSAVWLRHLWGLHSLQPISTARSRGCWGDLLATLLPPLAAVQCRGGQARVRARGIQWLSCALFTLLSGRLVLCPGRQALPFLGYLIGDTTTRSCDRVQHPVYTCQLPWCALYKMLFNSGTEYH